MREFRPMPTTPKAMRHFEQADKREIGRLLKPSHRLKLSHPCDRRVRPGEKEVFRGILKPSHRLKLSHPCDRRARSCEKEVFRGILKLSHRLRLSHPCDLRVWSGEKTVTILRDDLALPQFADAEDAADRQPPEEHDQG